MSLQYTRDKPYSDAMIADAESLHAESSLPSGKEGPSRLQWLVIISVFIVGGWVMANTLYTPKEFIAVKLDKDTTNALGALLHAADETHLGTSELAVRGLGASELAQLDKRGLNPFATFTSGNAGSKVSKQFMPVDPHQNVPHIRLASSLAVSAYSTLESVAVNKVGDYCYEIRVAMWSTHALRHRRFLLLRFRHYQRSHSHRCGSMGPHSSAQPGVLL
jgi:hypothetical protein